MEAANHAHRAEQINIKHALYRNDVSVNRRHGISYAPDIWSMYLNVLLKELHLRAVHEHIKTPTCQLKHRSFQISDGLLIGNIKSEETNPCI